MDKLWYIYTKEYYSTLKKNELLIPAATRMSFKKKKHAEISNSDFFFYKKSIYSMISCIQISRKFHFLGMESRTVIARGWSRWGRSGGRNYTGGNF